MHAQELGKLDLGDLAITVGIHGIVQLADCCNLAAVERRSCCRLQRTSCVVGASRILRQSDANLGIASCRQHDFGTTATTGYFGCVCDDECRLFLHSHRSDGCIIYVRNDLTLGALPSCLAICIHRFDCSTFAVVIRILLHQPNTKFSVRRVQQRHVTKVCIVDHATIIIIGLVHIMKATVDRDYPFSFPLKPDGVAISIAAAAIATISLVHFLKATVDRDYPFSFPLKPNGVAISIAAAAITTISLVHFLKTIVDGLLSTDIGRGSTNTSLRSSTREGTWLFHHRWHRRQQCSSILFGCGICALRCPFLEVAAF